MNEGSLVLLSQKFLCRLYVCSGVTWVINHLRAGNSINLNAWIPPTVQHREQYLLGCWFSLRNLSCQEHCNSEADGDNLYLLSK